MIYRWKHPTVTTHLFGIVQGFAEILDGVITLGSLGFFCSGFEFKVATLRDSAYLRQLIKEKNHDRT